MFEIMFLSFNSTSQPARRSATQFSKQHLSNSIAKNKKPPTTFWFVSCLFDLSQIIVFGPQQKPEGL